MSPSPLRAGLTRVALTDFRSYDQLRLTCDTRPVVLTGHNGAGKTNLLEAISFLSPGRGMRTARLSEVARTHIQDTTPIRRPWGVSVTLTRDDATVDIGTGLDPQPDKERRLVKIEGDLVKTQTDLSLHLSVLWLTPAMDRLFLEGATGRRRFLDRLVYGFDEAHAARTNRYTYHMQERARLLKQGGADPRWLSTIEAKIVEDGVAVTIARKQVVDQLNAAQDWALGVFPKPRLTLEGPLETSMHGKPALAIEEDWARALHDARGTDAQTGSPAVGPHRSDLSVLYIEKNQPAALCSTGEQKALLISIMMASARLMALQGRGAPIILFDEVVAHLDEGRRHTLFDEILNLGMQTWMTGTDADVFHELGVKSQHFQIENGIIRPHFVT